MGRGGMAGAPGNIVAMCVLAARHTSCLAGAPIGQKAAKVLQKDPTNRSVPLAFIRRSIGQRHAKVKRTGRIGACSALIRRLNHFLLLIPRNLVRVVSRVTRTIHWYLRCIMRANLTQTVGLAASHTPAIRTPRRLGSTKTAKCIFNVV